MKTSYYLFIIYYLSCLEVEDTTALTESQAEVAPAKVRPLDPPKYEIRPKLGEK